MSLYKAQVALQEVIDKRLTSRDPATHQLCVAMVEVMKALRRIESDVDDLKRK